MVKTGSRQLCCLVMLLYGLLPGWQQAVAAEDAASDAGGSEAVFVLPQGWTETTKLNQRGIRSFHTTQGTAVLFRAFERPDQTASKWAADELAQLQRDMPQSTTLKGGVRSEGFELVTPPTEITVGNSPWVVIRWDRPLAYQSRQVRQRTEQYFRKDGDTMLEVFVADAKERFNEFTQQELERFLSSIHLKAAQITGEALRRDFIPGDLAAHQVYGNPELGFSFAGPPGWSGLTQRQDASGRPVYDLPPAVRQVFKKEYPVGAARGPFTPWIEFQIGDLEQGKTPLETLRAYIQSLPPGEVTAAPAEVRIGDKMWATAEHRSVMQGNGRNMPMRVKEYLLAHKGKLIFLKGTSTAEEYNQDKILFDQAVASMKFSDALLTDILKDAVQRASDRAK